MQSQHNGVALLSVLIYTNICKTISNATKGDSACLEHL